MEKMRHYSMSLFSMLALPLVQLLLFAFYARVLGIKQYGYYIILMAWIPICVEFVAWGTGEVMIKRAGRDRESYRNAAGTFYCAIAITAAPAIFIYTLITTRLLQGEVAVPVIVVVGVCELIGYRLLIGAEQSALALSRFGAANAFRLMQAIPRAAFVFFGYQFGNQRTLTELSISGSIGILIGGILGGLIAFFYFGRPSWNLDRRYLAEGTWFASNQIIRASQQNIDRIVLSLLVSPSTLAIYGVAQRFVQMGLIPVQAILRTNYTEFFRRGSTGIGGAIDHGIKIIPWILGAASISCCGLWISKFFLIKIVGEGYEPSIHYMTLLAPSLLLSSLIYVGADILSGADKQMLRTFLMLSGVAVQALCFFLMPESNGIVLAVYLGLLVTFMMVWGTVLFLRRV